jgi:hypothetical protein
VNQSPTLLSALVAVATSSLAARHLDELMQHPAAPNLYWSLTDLPQPFIDFRAAYQGERLMAYGSFPGLPASPADELKPLTPEQVDNYVRLLIALNPGNLPVPQELYKYHIGLDMARKHEKAKQALVDAGWPRDKVEKIPHIQVGVLQGFVEYDRQLDEAVKWSNFPYWQAEPALRELNKRRPRRDRVPGPDEPAVPIADSLGSDLGRMMYVRTRVERKFAALRCLEAIRLYAAGHDGKLPAALDDIKEVPIPVDPFTGKPFEYHRTGDRATLYADSHAPPTRGRTANPQEALYYEIVMKR